MDRIIAEVAFPNMCEKANHILAIGLKIVHASKFRNRTAAANGNNAGLFR
jgi:hypothetical protein